MSAVLATVQGNTVGYVLLGASLVPGLIGWRLSSEGLRDAKAAAANVKNLAAQATGVVADVQTTLAEATGGDAKALADKASAVAEKTNDLDAAIGQVNDALNGMTGNLAPARVFLALAGLLITSALFAFNIITVG